MRVEARELALSKAAVIGKFPPKRDGYTPMEVFKTILDTKNLVVDFDETVAEATSFFWGVSA